MKENKEIHSELEQLSPLLARLRAAEKPLEAPENYFRDMQADVLWKLRQEALAQQEAAQGAPASVWWERVAHFIGALARKPAYAVAFAALAMLIAAAVWLMYPERQSAPQFSELTEEETLAYIEAHIDEFDTETLLPALLLAEALPNPASGMSEEEARELMDAMMKALDAETLQELF